MQQEDRVLEVGRAAVCWLLTSLSQTPMHTVVITDPPLRLKMTDQAHRLSTTSDPFATRPNSYASQMSGPAHVAHDSTSSSGCGDRNKELPLLAGGAAAAGVGAGVGSSYSNPYSAEPEMRQVPRGQGGGWGSNSMAYQNVPSESYWPDQDTGAQPFTPQRRSRKKWWIIGGVVLGIAAIAGIVAGVVVSQTRNKGSANGGSGSANSGNGNDSVLSNPNNPSSFAKDPRLHQSMWGLAYTPQVRTRTAMNIAVYT